MTESDKELLMLAAKAAGYRVARVADDGSALLLEGVQGPWNPLTDDGDALRLAVNFRMAVVIEPKYGLVYATVEGWRVGMEPEERIGVDPYAATRRAITRAAAEISRGAK